MAPDSLGGGRTVDDDAFEADQDDAESAGARMSFLEHLDELRRRLIYSVWAIVASCAVTFWWVNDLFTYMTTYFQANGGTLIYTRPMGGFMFSLKVAVLAGLILSAPFIFSQLWLFVAPGLYAREKRVVIPFVFLSSLLFFAGAAFAHLVGYPTMWTFFAGFQSESLRFFPDIDTTMSFYIRIVLAMGLVFQMPVLVFFLARFGIVTARFMIVKFKYAVLVIVVLAAVITPSGDAISLTVFVVPMLALYVISIAVAWLAARGRPAAEV